MIFKTNKYFFKENRLNAFEKILWNDVGLWIDFNVTSNSQRSPDPEYYFAYSFVPLWASLYWNGLIEGSYSSSYIESKVLDAINNIGMLNYIGGLPTSLRDTSQQWDFPNGWAPLQQFAVQGLPNLGSQGAELASSLASSWLQNNYNGWKASHLMYEKYNVTSSSGVPGSGGEYDVQAGFGWTNGVVLQFLMSYCTNPSCMYTKFSD